MSKAEGKKIGIKFTLPIVGGVAESVGAFTISGQEYLYVDGPNNNGPLVGKAYLVSKIEPHPTEQNSILLTVTGTTSFNSVVGDIMVSYSQSKGLLVGAGGAIESFDCEFTPSDLVEQGDPRVREYIMASANSTFELKYITKVLSYTKEYILAGMIGTITLIHTDDINP